MRFVIYRDAEGLFRWTLYEGDGPAIAMSMKAYSTKGDCFADIQKVRRSGDAEVDDHTLALAR